MKQLAVNLIFVLCLVSATGSAENMPASDSGKQPDPAFLPVSGVRIAASFESSMGSANVATVKARLYCVEPLPNHPSRLISDIKDARFTFRIYDKSKGQVFENSLIRYRRDYPKIDISIDSLVADTLSLSLVFGPLPYELTDLDSATGLLELFIPPDTNDNWSGLIASEPFPVVIHYPADELEETTFLAPRQIRLGRGPTLYCDSLDIDTLTVTSHRGLYLIRIAHLGSPHIPERIPAERHDRSFMQLPTLPELKELGFPFSAFQFEDGKVTVDIDISICESVNKPSSRMGIDFNGPHKVLWSKTYSVTITSDEYLGDLVDPDDNIDFRTCLIPYRVRVRPDKTIGFDKRDLVPMELRVSPGHDIGYAVTLDKQQRECFTGPPQSPLRQLRRKPSSDNPVEVTLCVFQYDTVSTHEHDRPMCDRTQNFLCRGCKIDQDTGTFSLFIPDPLPSPGRPSFRWRQYMVPRSVAVSPEGDVVFDSTDMLPVGFSHADGQWPLFRVTLGEQQSQLMATQLPYPITKWRPISSEDSAAGITIEIVTFNPTNIPRGDTPFAIWSRSYQLVSPQAGTSVREAD